MSLPNADTDFTTEISIILRLDKASVLIRSSPTHGVAKINIFADGMVVKTCGRKDKTVGDFFYVILGFFGIFGVFPIIFIIAIFDDFPIIVRILGIDKVIHNGFHTAIMVNMGMADNHADNRTFQHVIRIR